MTYKANFSYIPSPKSEFLSIEGVVKQAVEAAGKKVASRIRGVPGVHRGKVAITGGGIEKALRSSPPILSGLNVYKGKLTNQAVAKALGIKYSAYKLRDG